MGRPDLSIERAGNVIRLMRTELEEETCSCIAEAEGDEDQIRDRFEDEAEAIYNAAWDIYHTYIRETAEEIREPAGKILLSVIEQYMLDKAADLRHRLAGWLLAWIPHGWG